MLRSGVGTAVAAALMLSACAEARPQSASADAPATKGKGPGRNKGYSHDPFPSTYKAYPGVPTLVRNVTIYDGEGGRIDNGAALFADGKVVAVGQTVDAPANATVIDLSPPRWPTSWPLKPA